MTNLNSSRFSQTISNINCNNNDELFVKFSTLENNYVYEISCNNRDSIIFQPKSDKIDYNRYQELDLYKYEYNDVVLHVYLLSQREGND